ncbi:hypothetical protein E4U30_002248 [Claviceps sp. LM220 group G6]|nr:hypothetical protein E4U15_003932 [Claviceps sp. LM218 group G6]KAG6102712.1 hypothetical protein E4U30_002248 [Claviceps sp. LM220 group G6]
MRQRMKLPQSLKLEQGIQIHGKAAYRRVRDKEKRNLRLAGPVGGGKLALHARQPGVDSWAPAAVDRRGPPCLPKTGHRMLSASSVHELGVLVAFSREGLTCLPGRKWRLRQVKGRQGNKSMAVVGAEVNRMQLGRRPLRANTDSVWSGCLAEKWTKVD